MTVSIGVTGATVVDLARYELSPSGDAISHLIARAGRAMYRAKAAGSDCVMS